MLRREEKKRKPMDMTYLPTHVDSSSYPQSSGISLRLIPQLLG